MHPQRGASNSSMRKAATVSWTAFSVASLPDTPVNNGLFHRGKAVLAAHNQFAQGEHKIAFQGKGAFVARVVQVQIQGIDVVFRGGRNVDYLPVKPLHQGGVFRFGITDDDVIVCQQEAVGNLPLGRKALSGAGGAQNQAVGVFQQFPVHHDEVIGQGVDAAVKGLRTDLEQLLGGKGNKDAGAGAGKPPLDLDAVLSQGQGADKPLFLLKVQADQLAVVFLDNGLGLENGVVQLTLGASGVEDQERDQEHPFVPVLQILEKLFGLRTVGGQIRRNDVHVITGPHSLFLFLNLCPVQVGNLPLYRLDSLYLIHGLDMHGYNHGAFCVQKIHQHPVVHFRRKNLQESHRAQVFSNGELPSGGECKGAGGDKVFYGKTGGSKPIPLEPEWKLLIHVESGVKLGKPLLSIQGPGGYADLLEVVENIYLQALQPQLGCAQVVRLDGEGEILGFDQTVVSLGQLIFQHLGILLSDVVKIIALERNAGASGKGLPAGGHVEKGKLKVNGTVKIVQEITPGIEDGGFVIVLAQLVVDILKLNSFVIEPFPDTADAVRPHPLKGDGVLGGFLLGIRPLCPFNCLGNLLSFCPAQLSSGRFWLFVFRSFSQELEEQYGIPPG